MQTHTGKNYTSLDLGTLSSINNSTFELPGLGKIKGKQFLKQILGLTGMEVSLNILPPQARMPFSHRHRRNEELYFFLKGEGLFQVDGESMPIREGSFIRVSPEGERIWENTGTDELMYVVIQARVDSLPESDVKDGELVQSY